MLVDKIDIIPGFRTDHSIICLVLQCTPISRGPGYWRINNSFLKDIDYVNKINQLINIELECSKEFGGKKVWELLKLTCRSSTIQYANCLKKSNKLMLTALEKKVKQLELELQNPLPQFNDTLN